MFLNDEIIKLMKQENCNIVGFADLRCLSKEVRQNFDYGIVIALSYSKEAMQENTNGNIQPYYNEFKPKNPRLNQLILKIEQYLVYRGYKALAKTQSMTVQDEDLRTVLPHKTVATLAGIGWIGKCAMLVTDKVGSALRISVVLTNAPLECGVPITKSKCPPNCTVCADICPGKAPLDGDVPLWESNVDRADFFDANACCTAARKRAKEMLGIGDTLCGLCMSVCPFTKRGLGYS